MNLLYNICLDVKGGVGTGLQRTAVEELSFLKLFED